MRSIRPSRRVVTILTCAALAACADGTGPGTGPELDAETALADYDALEAVLASGALDGFRALEGRAPSAEATGAGPLAAPIISESHRGATFVYDPAADRYAVDDGREGAPATGVRFVLYDVDAAGVPIVDAERGYADLVDEGDASAEDVSLRLTVVDRGNTVLEYATTLDHGAGSGALTVRGFVRDEVRLDFEIRAVGAETGGRALRPRERLVLWRVLDIVEDVFDFLEDLVDPVDEIVALGFVL